jgi:hypothetical protein
MISIILDNISSKLNYTYHGLTSRELNFRHKFKIGYITPIIDVAAEYYYISGPCTDESISYVLSKTNCFNTDLSTIKSEHNYAAILKLYAITNIKYIVTAKDSTIIIYAIENTGHDKYPSINITRAYYDHNEITYSIACNAVFSVLAAETIDIREPDSMDRIQKMLAGETNNNDINGLIKIDLFMSIDNVDWARRPEAVDNIQ